MESEYIPEDLREVVKEVTYWEKDYDYMAIAHLADVYFKYPYVSKTVYSDGTVQYESREPLLMENIWESYVREHACKLSKIQYWWYMYEKKIIKGKISSIRHVWYSLKRRIRLWRVTRTDAEDILRNECNKQKTCVNCKMRYFCETRTEKLIKYTSKYDYADNDDDDYDTDY